MSDIRTADMVVIGTGASGLVAALAARSQGLEPLVVEKADVVGGTSAFSGGVLWIPDNPVMRAAGAQDSFENGMTYLDAVVGDEGPATSKARKTAFLREGPRMVQFMLDLGIEFNYSDGYPDYYPHMPGGHTRGRGINTVHFDLVRLGAWEQWVRPNPKNGIQVNLLMKSLTEGPVMTRPLTSLQGPKMMLKVGSRTAFAKLRRRNTRAMGQALVAHLLYQAQRLGIHFWLGTPMQDLVVEDGRVVGVRVRRDGRDIEVRATHGVVLAAGGFARNDLMRKQHHPQPSSSAWSVASPDDNGDGITAGMQHGAATSLMDESVWVPSSLLPDGTSMINLWERSLPHSIMVDAAGNRFCNEAGSYMDICQLAYARHNEATAIPSWLIIDARHRRLYPFGTIPPGYTPKSWITSGYMKKANSIEGIASACGIDPAGLQRTVERFNTMAEAGVDEDFHRGENAYDAHYGEPKHKPNPCLGPLSTPPYYAVAIYPGDCGTSGGLLTNEHGQVLAQDGQPIAGLYAAGVNAAPVLGRKYPGAGASLGPVTVSGFIAGSHIAAQARGLQSVEGGGTVTLPYETDEGWGPLREPPHVSREFGPADQPWRETSWLVFWDRGSDLYGAVHLSTSPNAGARRARASLSLGGRTGEVIEPLEPMQMASTSIKLDLDGALSVRGPNLTVDLTMAPRLAVADYSAARSVPGLSEAEPLRHYQRSGTVQGTAQLGDTETGFSGPCYRDRTRGYRDEISAWNEYYAMCLCWPDFDLTLMKFRSPRGDHHHGFRVGARGDVVQETSVRRDSWGDVCRVDCVLADAGPFGFDVGRPCAELGVPMGDPDGPVAISARDAFVEVRTDDGQAGFGIVEQGIQYRMG